jgi:NADH-quinone oxidoreductase chain I
MSYFRNIADAVTTTLAGMRVTLKNAFIHPVTLQYPEEKHTVPERFRGQLFLRVEDCIACDQCARICPVDCIYLDSVKRAPEDVAETSDGSKKRLWLTRFDIDVTLCMVCGLCSEVCPTDCLYHTHEYEIAPRHRRGMFLVFADPGDIDKGREAAVRWDREKKEKAAAAAAAAAAKAAEPKPAAEAGTAGEAKAAAPEEKKPETGGAGGA